MSELISGKDALIALANGEEVEYYKHAWMDVNRLSVRDLTSSDSIYKFRLKPQTIKINGIEVPKPDYIVDTPHDYDGCWEINIGGTYYLFKTEQNYKQVVEALRSVFNG